MFGTSGMQKHKDASNKCQYKRDICMKAVNILASSRGKEAKQASEVLFSWSYGLRPRMPDLVNTSQRLKPTLSRKPQRRLTPTNGIYHL